MDDASTDSWEFDMSDSDGEDRRSEIAPVAARDVQTIEAPVANRQVDPTEPMDPEHHESVYLVDGVPMVLGPLSRYVQEPRSPAMRFRFRFALADCIREFNKTKRAKRKRFGHVSRSIEDHVSTFINVRVMMRRRGWKIQKSINQTRYSWIFVPSRPGSQPVNILVENETSTR